MSDQTPDYSNRLAFLISMIFHPYIVYLVPIFIVVDPQDWVWIPLLFVVLIAPVAFIVTWLRRQERFAYQRDTRTPIYLAAICSVLTGLIITFVFNAPLSIRVGLATVVFWLPVQFAVNTWITKASIHTAIVSICITGLFYLGYFDTPLLKMTAILIIIAISWSRMVTRNHTLLQVSLGVFCGAASTVTVFSLLA